MDERLRPLNALLGLLTPNDINPARLLEAGFSLEGLEIPVSGPGGNVVIDALLFNAQANLLVAIESKSGGNIEIEQARKYDQIEATAVVQASQVSIGKRRSLRLEIVYLCNTEHADRIRLGLSEAGVSFPILAVDDKIVSLRSVSDTAPELSEAFATPVQLEGPPPRYIPFDGDSSPLAAQSLVRAQLIADLSHRRPQVSTTWLAEQTAPHCSLYGRVARNKLVKVVAEAARQIAAEDPSTFEFIGVRGNEPAVVKLLRTPEDHDPRGRTQSYQALARPSRPSRRRPQVDPSQLDLLQTLDEADDVQDTDEADREEER